MAKRRFKFNSIVITRATIVAGRGVMPGEILPIYSEESEITEEDVLLLFSRDGALEASKENIAEVKKKITAATSVLEKRAEELARSEKKSHELATEAIERADALQGDVEALQEELAGQQVRVDGLEKMFSDLVATMTENASDENEKDS